jgi:hypothetical protein
LVDFKKVVDLKGHVFSHLWLAASSQQLTADSFEYSHKAGGNQSGFFI